MAIKTAYKPKKLEPPPVEASAADNVPEIKLDGVAAEPVAAISVEASPDVEPAEVQQAIEVAAKADDAALALKRQVEALRQSEALQAQQQAVIAAQRPMSREEKIALWRQQGLSDKEAEFLRQHDRLIDFPEITGLAANEALAAGIERDSAAYWQAVEEGFDKHMTQLKAQAEAMQKTPAFFQPPPAPPPPAPRTAASYVSAPVSRDVPGPDRERYGNPGRVTLTPEQLEIARTSGISATEYARNLLRLQAEKRAGTRQ